MSQEIVEKIRKEIEEYGEGKLSCIDENNLRKSGISVQSICQEEGWILDLNPELLTQRILPINEGTVECSLIEDTIKNQSPQTAQPISLENPDTFKDLKEVPEDSLEAKLYHIIDNIDTGLDVYKPEMEGFEKHVLSQIQKKNDLIVSDGYKLYYAEPEKRTGVVAKIEIEGMPDILLKSATFPKMKLPGINVFEALKEQIKNDDGYAWSWHCNIAMASIDQGFDHGKANIAAARFMKNCFDVDVTEFKEFKALFLSLKNQTQGTNMDNTSNKDFLEYLEKEMSEGKIDFSFRATPSENGIDINIHPSGANGETIDFSLFKQGDEVCLAVKCKTEWNKQRIPIFINGTELHLPVGKKSVSYEDICELDCKDLKITYSMTYLGKLGGDLKKEGILSPGQSVGVVDYMRFNVFFIP